jgi:hypothetical protein
VRRVRSFIGSYPAAVGIKEVRVPQRFLDHNPINHRLTRNIKRSPTNLRHVRDNGGNERPQDRDMPGSD